MNVYAHSIADHPKTSWEHLKVHLALTAQLAGHHAGAFGWASVGEPLGRLHDIGKVSSEFQAYIAKTKLQGESARGPDHSTAGARAACRYGKLSRLLAYAIAGHHAGLADAANLDQRLDPARLLPLHEGWEEQAGALPDLPALRPTWPMLREERHKGFGAAFLTRMLFSCLVDADFIATEAFYAAAEGKQVERGKRLGPVHLLDRLHRFEARRTTLASPLNALRSSIRTHAVAKAVLPPGPFTLTVPTGGGKTLTSLSFALEHAVRHGLRRVGYVVAPRAGAWIEPWRTTVSRASATFGLLTDGACVV